MGPRVVVIGGGLAGLATAHHLLRARPDLELTLLDGAARPGGKVRQQTVGGVRVDVGAESVVASSVAARELFAELGLAEQVVHPEPVPASFWSRGGRHAIPGRTFMGVPGPQTDLTGLLDEGEVARAAQPAPFALESEDVTIADAVGTVYGRAVVDRVVEPLLGGVYAGRVDHLSLRSTMPALWAAMAGGRSMPTAVESLLPPPHATPRPRVMGLAGGIGVLVEALHRSVVDAGGRIETGALVRRLERTPTGWRVVSGATNAEVAREADVIVVATPAAATSRLLADHAAAAASALAGIEYASMAVITIALPTVTAPPLPGSGFLVPAVDGRPIKASTFSASKWAWVREAADDVVLLRASAGRAGEVVTLQRDDTELIADALAEIGRALGVDLPRPVDAHVQRWGGGLPQYDLGHTGRVAAVRSAVAGVPGLEVTGAAYDGVGIGAVLTDAAATATTILDTLPPSSTTRQEPR
ncbi:protoporphyrinogen oxidase [Janibacter limosus]|uniref:Coproporphyrinogen III oxidase n=1 Tax=Janibacter limosus TaxID=53458 RepID=A0A4P6MRI1_9MICO|nr:protoporphyrinogen oxidase [Janibacter limosus]QBF46134.1 protoporphyrinogen oxidase [Janibacter limosus]